jgi:hypothetical protein
LAGYPRRPPRHSESEVAPSRIAERGPACACRGSAEAATHARAVSADKQRAEAAKKESADWRVRAAEAEKRQADMGRRIAEAEEEAERLADAPQGAGRASRSVRA